MFEMMKKITDQMITERQSKYFREYRMLCDSLIAYIHDQAVYILGSGRFHGITDKNIEFLQHFVIDEKELFYLITQDSLSKRMYETYKYAYQIHIKLKDLSSLLLKAKSVVQA